MSGSRSECSVGGFTIGCVLCAFPGVLRTGGGEGGLKQQKVLAQSSRGWNSQVRVPVPLVARGVSSLLVDACGALTW